jgi:GxxExxY protein
VKNFTSCDTRRVKCSRKNVTASSGDGSFFVSSDKFPNERQTGHEGHEGERRARRKTVIPGRECYYSAWRLIFDLGMALDHEDADGISKTVIGMAIEVHQTLGPGLLESNYEECMCIELALAKLQFRNQPPVPVFYKQTKLRKRFRPDIIVARKLIIEIKCVEKLAPIHTAQVLTYLKHTDLHVGLLFNFNSETLVSGMKRIVR